MRKGCILIWCWYCSYVRASRRVVVSLDGIRSGLILAKTVDRVALIKQLSGYNQVLQGEVHALQEQLLQSRSRRKVLHTASTTEYIAGKDGPQTFAYEQYHRESASKEVRGTGTRDAVLSPPDNALVQKSGAENSRWTQQAQDGQDKSPTTTPIPSDPVTKALIYFAFPLLILGCCLPLCIAAWCLWERKKGLRGLAMMKPESRKQFFVQDRVMYEWSQTSSTITFYTLPPSGVTKSNLEVSITPSNLTIGRRLKPTFLNEELFSFVDVEASSWNVSRDGELEIHLAKAVVENWPCLFKAHQPMDNEGSGGFLGLVPKEF